MFRPTKESILRRRSVCGLALGLALSMTQALAHQSPRGLIEIDWPMKNITRTLSAGFPPFKKLMGTVASPKHTRNMTIC